MAIRLVLPRDPGARVTEPSDFAAGGQRALQGAAGRQLEEALERYCQGLTGGRSFAISGLRGVGKTTMVLAAVESLTSRSHQLDAQRQPTSDATAAARPDNKRWLRRPLLVRLSAPDILRSPLPPAEGMQPDATANLVRQLARGLHLAATKEFARCYRGRLLDSAKRPRKGLQSECFEAAAQLALELSRGTRADAIRRFWELAGCFESGVLFSNPPTQDQGMRELAALDLSALAFQIAIGTYSEDDNGDDTAKYNGDTSKTLDQIKAAAGPIGGLFSGLVTGIGTGLKAQDFNQALLAAASGLGVALAFTALATPILTRNRTAKWSFKPDTTEGSLVWRLERAVDLFFEAGLAVVFVLDELDKVDRTMLIHANHAAQRASAQAKSAASAAKSPAPSASK